MSCQHFLNLVQNLNCNWIHFIFIPCYPLIHHHLWRVSIRNKKEKKTSTSERVERMDIFEWMWGVSGKSAGFGLGPINHGIIRTCLPYCIISILLIKETLHTLLIMLRKCSYSFRILSAFVSADKYYLDKSIQNNNQWIKADIYFPKQLSK